MIELDRYILNYGSEDVSDFYAKLLKQVSFPYAELDMNRRLDREIISEMRTRTCIMLEVSIGLPSAYSPASAS